MLALVESLRASAGDRDAQAIADRLSDDFKGNGTVDKAEAAATLRRYFAAYESVHLLVYDVAVPAAHGGRSGRQLPGRVQGSARRIRRPRRIPPPSAVEALRPPSRAPRLRLER